MKITENDKKISIAIAAKNQQEERIARIKRAFIESLQGERKQ